MYLLPNKKGITLLEVLFAVTIFALLIMGTGSLLIDSFRSNAIIWDQLQVQADGRRVLQQVVNDVRRAESSSIGAYALEKTSPYELIFYSNLDDIGYRERVRYFMNGTTLEKGVVFASGTPLGYPTSTEQITDIAVHVRNQENNLPIFTYFGDTYTGTQAAMTTPVDPTLVRLINVTLLMDKSALTSPTPLQVQSTVSVRNLKKN